MSIKQIIEAIELGDASSVTALFDKLMASKLEECIEEKKQELAESMFEEESVDELDEEFEALDELSKSTLGAYANRALNNVRNDNQAKVRFQAAKNNTDDEKKWEGEANRRAKTREKGVRQAIKRLTKEQFGGFLESEEFQALDELSKTTLGSYVKKAANNMAVTHASKVSKDAEAEEVDRFTNRHMKNKFANQDKIKDMVGASQSERNELHRKTMKRMSGIGKATDKLTK